MEKKYIKLMPNTYIILVISHIFYYWNVFFKEDIELVIVLFRALIYALLGYLIVYNAISMNKSKMRKRKEISLDRVLKFAKLFIFIGVLAHIAFYLPNIKNINSYVDNYALGRGKGYITIFFDFFIIGIVLIEYCNKYGKISKKKLIRYRMMAITYCIFYIFILKKRRQIILLLIWVISMLFYKTSKGKKTLLYILAMIGYCTLIIFGKVRGYVNINGFEGIFRYIKTNYNIDWISPSQFEGKYMVMILKDVMEYIKNFGFEYSILIGVIFCIIPRSIFGGIKPLAFPEWYAYTFHYQEYLKGAGYAGSSIAESYLIGGEFFLIIVYSVVGALCCYFQSELNKAYYLDKKINVFYGLFIYILILFPRLDLATILINFLFLYMPIKIAFYFSNIKINFRS